MKPRRLGVCTHLLTVPQTADEEPGESSRRKSRRTRRKKRSRRRRRTRRRRRWRRMAREGGK